MQIAEIATGCKTTMAEIAHLEVCWFKTIAHEPSRSYIDQVGSAEPTLTLFSAQVTWALLHSGEDIHFTGSHRLSLSLSCLANEDHETVQSSTSTDWTSVAWYEQMTHVCTQCALMYKHI